MAVRKFRTSATNYANLQNRRSSTRSLDGDYEGPRCSSCSACWTGACSGFSDVSMSRMRGFCICGRGFDGTSGGADSLLDVPFTRGQRVVRDVQRVVLDFHFNHAFERCDRVGQLLLTSGISELLKLNPRGHSFTQARIGTVTFFIHIFKSVRATSDGLVYPRRNKIAEVADNHADDLANRGPRRVAIKASPI